RRLSGQSVRNLQRTVHGQRKRERKWQIGQWRHAHHLDRLWDRCDSNQHLTRTKIQQRRGGDSNPRNEVSAPFNGLANRRLRPLGHLSYGTTSKVEKSKIKPDRSASTF